MDYKEIKQAILRDLDWHLQKKGMTKNEDFERGFEAGMRQALIVIDLVTNDENQCGMSLAS